MKKVTDFGKNLKLLRKNNALTQANLADILEVTRMTIKNYESGRTRPDIDTLAFLADYFKVSIDSLLGVSVFEGDEPLRFNEHLKVLRKLKKITPSELCSQININQGTYSRWENGTLEPNILQLVVLSLYYDVSIDYLVGKINVDFLTFQNKLDNKDYDLSLFDNLGDRLKALRKSHGFTQEGISQLLGIGQSSYAKWENGKTEPSLTDIWKLSRILGVSTDDLLIVK